MRRWKDMGDIKTVDLNTSQPIPTRRITLPKVSGACRSKATPIKVEVKSVGAFDSPTLPHRTSVASGRIVLIRAEYRRRVHDDSPLLALPGSMPSRSISRPLFWLQVHLTTVEWRATASLSLGPFHRQSQSSRMVRTGYR